MTTPKSIERTQTGVRIATPLLKVLKGLAEYKDISLGDLLEGIVLHSFEGKQPFSEETLEVIGKLREVYDCRLTAADAHKLTESPEQQG
jgi:hypothetical protein